MQRLEAIREDWLNTSSVLVEDFVNQVTQSGLDNFKSNELLCRSIQKKRDEWIEKELLPSCMSWLQDYELWQSSEEVFEDSQAELSRSILVYLPPFSYELPEPVLSTTPTPSRIYAILAGGGAFLGMLTVAPLTVLMLDQRDIGLFAGGILGAIGFVRMLAPWLGRDKKPRLISLPGKHLLEGRTDLSQENDHSTFIWESNTHQISQELKIHLQHVADLVLAWCWGHPKRLLFEKECANQDSQKLPTPILDCLSTLYYFSSLDKGTSHDIHNLLKELFQRFQTYGYKWEVIPSGTPFNPETMEDSFDTYGDIELDEFIFTYQPALHYQNTLIRKGELRSIDD